MNQSVEQGIYVVLMLALQKGHTPVKSSVLSNILGVSDSYLKKLLRKMVIDGIMTSSASKDGGYQLAKSVEEITVYDIYRTLDGGGLGFEVSGIAHNIFVDDAKLARNEARVVDIFEKAVEAYEDELKRLSLSELLIKKNYRNGWTDWESHLSDMEHPE